MIPRKPVFTILSLLVALLFALGSRPFLVASLEQQLAEATMNSADAMEDRSRMAAFALIGGQVIMGGLGAALGAMLAGLAFWRKEKWPPLRCASLLLNLVAAGMVGATVIPAWWTQHRKAESRATHPTPAPAQMPPSAPS